MTPWWPDQIYGFLLTRNSKDQIEPGLVSAWTFGTDSLTSTLRPGLTFSDGEPFDAQAVKDGILHNKSNTMFTELHAVTGVDVLNPTTVRIDLSDNSSVRLAYALTESSGEIPAPSTLDGSFAHPVGAVLFQFVSYTKDRNRDLTRLSPITPASTYKPQRLRVRASRLGAAVCHRSLVWLRGLRAIAGRLVRRRSLE